MFSIFAQKMIKMMNECILFCRKMLEAEVCAVICKYLIACEIKVVGVGDVAKSLITVCVILFHGKGSYTMIQ